VEGSGETTVDFRTMSQLLDEVGFFCGGGSIKELHVISTGKMPLDELARIIADIYPLLTAIHLREKHLTARELFDGVSMLLKSGVSLTQIMINDRIDVAAASHAKGVQLAYHSLDVDKVKQSFPALRTGSSIHSPQEAIMKESQGADYLLFGHIYPTGSKPGLEPRGLKALQEVVESVQIPVIAIGGIKPHHVKDVLKTGAAGIAVLSTILEAENPLEMTKAYRRAMEEADE